MALIVGWEILPIKDFFTLIHSFFTRILDNLGNFSEMLIPHICLILGHYSTAYLVRAEGESLTNDMIAL